MKLVALTPIRHGDERGVHAIAEGETFDFDKTSAEKLLAIGAVRAPEKGGKSSAAAEAERKAAEEEAARKAEEEQRAAEAVLAEARAQALADAES